MCFSLKYKGFVYSVCLDLRQVCFFLCPMPSQPDFVEAVDWTFKWTCGETQNKCGNKHTNTLYRHPIFLHQEPATFHVIHNANESLPLRPLVRQNHQNQYHSSHVQINFLPFRRRKNQKFSTLFFLQWILQLLLFFPPPLLEFTQSLHYCYFTHYEWEEFN